MAGPGRPKKHLQQDHHFQTSDEAAAAGAPPVAADAGDVALATDSAPAALEAVVENPTMHTPELDSEPANVILTESPAEEKIHQLVEQQRVYAMEKAEYDLNGWQRMDNAPLGGMTINVNNLPAGDGTDAFFKRTRVFNGKRYIETGIWVDHMTGVKIPYEPKYWRPRF